MSSIGRDPLAGQREAINADTLHMLVWEIGEEEKPCPVQKGQVFGLRQCWIEITRIERTKREGKFTWRAEFTRHRRLSSKPYYLGPRGYVHQPREAMKAEDDPVAATLDTISPFDEDYEHRALGEPPEPEGPHPDEVGDFEGSRAARDRYEREIQAQRAEFNNQPIAQRMKRILDAQDQGANVGREVRAIHGMLSRAERKIGLRRVA